MKSVLISICPQWCEKIASGEKTIEVRKTAPKEVPFKAYIYCTRIIDKKHCRDEFDIGIWKGNEHIIGEFICDKVYNLVNAFGGIVFADENLNQLDPQPFRDMSCLTDEQTADYLGDKDGYGWHISDLKIYDKPKELSEFKTGCKGCKERDTYHCKFYCYGERPLTRPPQSYMFVEELGE